MPDNSVENMYARGDGNRNKLPGLHDRKRIKTTKVKTGCRTCKVSSTDSREFEQPIEGIWRALTDRDF
jgi:hypothetical protein